MKAAVPTERQTQRAILKMAGAAEAGRPIPALSPVQLERFREKHVHGQQDECWPWLAPKGTGRYGMFRIGATKYLPHRIAWALAHGQVPAGMCVCHLCDNPRCVNPAHLFLGSHADNMADMHHKGRHRTSPLRGDDAPWAKLTSNDAARIRADARNQYVIAAEYGINQSSVSDIKRGKIWRDA